MDYDALARALLRQSPDLVSGMTGVGGGVAELRRDVGSVSLGAGVDGGEVGSDGVVDGRGDANVTLHWADAVSEVSSSSVVSGGLPGPVSDEVREVVKFGEVSGAYPDGRRANDQKSVEKGFYGTFVRRYEAKKAFDVIRRYTGVKLPKAAHVELALATFTAGTMPSAFADGKERLRALAVVGDAAITVHLACSLYVLGRSVESMQSLRSSVTTDASLRDAMHRSGLVECVSLPPGVDAKVAKPVATAFEAFVGVLYLYTDTTVVRDFLRGTGIIE